MGQLTPQFLFDLQTRMRQITATDYQSLTANMWWNRVASETTMTGAKERLYFLLDTAKIDYVNKLGGEQAFEELLYHSFEYEAKAAANALKLQRHQLDDLDGGGIKLASEWSRQVAQYAAYWPQKQVATAIKNGAAATSLAYDGVPFFSASHKLNPLDSGSALYANLFTGAASGSYPGACPINGVTLDVAITNLQKVFTYIRGLTMINGEDPRFLRPEAILVPPALSTIAQQLTNAKFVAQAAASGGGSGDIQAIVQNWGIGQPIEVDEFAATVGGSDTTYYVLARQIGQGELGPIMYGNREPFQVLYHDGMTDAQLLMQDELVWKIRGRNVVYYGHPYLLFRVQAT